MHCGDMFYHKSYRQPNLAYGAYFACKDAKKSSNLEMYCIFHYLSHETERFPLEFSDP